MLLLGRYQSDCPVAMRQWQSRFRDSLNIDFKTVHSSKGLEADYVMILNVIEGERGFPCQIEDDPVLQLPMPAPDTFPMSEERRLFYVALTRARREVRIYTDITHPSRFLLELTKNAALVIEPIDSSAKEMCPKCGRGVLTLKKGRYGDFTRCNTWPSCNFSKSVTTISSGVGSAPIRLTGFVSPGSSCPTCQRGRMGERNGMFGSFLGCSEYPSCKTISKGQ